MRHPVTAADVELSVALSSAAIRGVAAPDWGAHAGALEWDCWETVEHVSDDLFAYAAQLCPTNPPLKGYVPFMSGPQRPGGPRSTIFADRAAGPDGLLQVFEASGALLVAMVATSSPQLRAYHPMGIADPEGFAAMGVVEVLVHTHDVTQGFGTGWTPPADLCARVLGRLFPDAPTGADPWSTLLWATGRGELPGRAVLSRWRWYAAPHDEI
ncbi:maleylpyruvate isomerase N-terminal domain-containing protein [Planosporangium mesophilum]|nr:maleylpyruvate isomerase N-terminal domain-containing protein [Planosporangium mesophilum]NJC81935.1 hypothetical protein [Planosporangium mesophilum]